MSFKRKDLEIAYSLRWKNGPKREDKEMSIISVYDIPATTLNFEVFKSYLLKNSGTAEHDVRVSFVMDNGREYPIQSQTDFQVALYAFRRKARSGELINLLLEKISDQPIHKNLRHSNDVETQFDNLEPSSIVSACCNAEIPPEWFIASMAQLKKDIAEDITATVSSVVSSALGNIKPQIVSQMPCHHHSRKCKPEKRIRKITPHMTESNVDAKDLKKSLKLEHKLDKLEFKAAKYREKRLALQNAPKSSDSEAGHSSSRSRSRDKAAKQEDSEPKMDAKPVNCQTAVPHMVGGEVYMHQWEVENSGEAPWTSKTHLQYTWGSKALKPLNKIVSVPYLKPGARGIISARLQVPNESGQYECYWQFMHKDRRFGSWLGCEIIVDPFDLKGNRSVLETTRLAIENHFSVDPEPQETFQERVEDVALLQSFLRGTDSEPPKRSVETANSAEALASLYNSLQGDRSDAVKNITEQLVREVTSNIERINLHENLDSDSNCSFYDNESFFEGSSSSKNSFKDEFVVVPVPKCFMLDGQDNVEHNLEKPNENSGKDSPKKTENDEKLIEKVASAVHKGSLEQAGCSGTISKKSSEKVLNTLENNFDDNNNTESGSGTSNNSIKLRDEDLDNIVVITVPKDDQVKEGYIYVHVDGQKVLIPKNILKSEVVIAAQELEKSPGSRNSVGVIVDSNEALNQTPTPSLASTLTRQASQYSEINGDDNVGNTTDSASVLTSKPSQKQDNVAIDMTMTSMKDNDHVHNHEPVNSNYFEANNYMSHCSAAGSCYSEINSQSERNSRLFIFPQNVPGYEVVHPVLDTINTLYPNLTNEPYVPPASAPVEFPPPVNPFVEHVPNFQQTPPEQRAAPVPPADSPSANQSQEVPFKVFESVPTDGSANRKENEGVRSGFNQQAGGANTGPAQVNILPEMLVSGAVNAASTAFSTARSVLNNMIRPQSPGNWVNGHWVSTSPQTPREANLQALADMGFWNRDLNATLLARFNDDLNRVVAELVQ